ncbi:MAG: CapA family protein [Verrucomicrobia bacterium]|nr:CapA family protein [Verrucomicrobiota bacterium]
MSISHFVPTFLILTLFSSVGWTAEPWEWQVPNTQERAVILLMGDTNIQHRTDPTEGYRTVKATLNEADIRFANLEGPFAGSSKDPRIKDIPHKSWTHSEPDQVWTLVDGGIDVVGVANNVTWPWQALMRSLDVLDGAGILHAGGGKNIDEAHKPVVVIRDGVKIGFLSFAATVFPFEHAATDIRPGIAEIKAYTAYQPPSNLDKPGQPPIVLTWLDKESKARMVEGVSKLKAKTDIVITSFHWGVSGTTTIVSYQRDIARAVVDAGADVVFGHGPHKYQPIEVYKDRPIFYSAGQFLFDDPTRKEKHREGMLVRVLATKEGFEDISFVPTWRSGDGLTIILHDPNYGKGRELFGYLKSVMDDESAKLHIEGKEIKFQQ